MKYSPEIVRHADEINPVSKEALAVPFVKYSVSTLSCRDAWTNKEQMDRWDVHFSGCRLAETPIFQMQKAK